jgi:S-methylmethionine-dependent homocysteine/selenocysteine methylase
MMAKYRNQLPQLGGDIFMTDGGLETTLIFHDGIDLPYFAAFDLMKSDEGKKRLYDYFVSYADIAKKNEVGLILESATWRASSDWGTKLGYDTTALKKANKEFISFLNNIRDDHENEKTPMVISGCLGPRGDGYSIDELMSPEEASDYHSEQINAFAEAETDMVSALTMTYASEAIGVTLASKKAGIPVTISFTVETDGKLPSGQTLKGAIREVDDATENGPAYYMINCAHPSHFDEVLPGGELWADRIRGIRANASRKSHAELDEAEELDDGNPTEMGQEFKALKERLYKLNVLGGCCGTDQRHLEQIIVATK